MGGALFPSLSGGHGHAWLSFGLQLCGDSAFNVVDDFLDQVVQVPMRTHLFDAFDSTVHRLFDGSDATPVQSMIDPGIQKHEDELRQEASDNGFGTLTYRDLYDAHDDMLCRRTTPNQEEEYLLAYIHAYNDARYGRAGVEKEEPSLGYRLRFEDYIGQLTAMWQEPSALCAELIREFGGHFDECIEMCHKLLDSEIDIEFVRQILARAEVHDSEVFEI